MPQLSISPARASFDIQAIGLSTYSQGGYADAGVVDLIQRAAASGADHVVLSNVVLADLATGVIGPVIENGQNQTARMSDVSRAIDAAHALGIEVILKPQLAVRDPAFDQYNTASWIMMVNPDLVIARPAAFFAAYKAHILEWAVLAEQHHVGVLSIGNEMVAATKPQYTPYWNDIIAAVRGVFHGQLTYSALAPVMTNASSNEIAQIGFWNRLDYAGFDVYPSLTHSADASAGELAAGWRDAVVYGHRQDYVAFLATMATAVGKPVLFTETGLPSFNGASDREATSDGTIGSGARATDQHEQADWWQAFFQVWATNPPAWLKGMVVYNNDPARLGAYYDQNYNVNGKLAEAVIASWFGGGGVIAPTANALSGSQADDHLFLYGPGAPQAANQAASLTTTVSVTLTGAILGGAAPVIHAYVNGVDLGAVTLKPVDSGYVDEAGVHFTTDQTYRFELPGLVKIDQLKIALDSPARVGGQASTTYFHSVEVDGVRLASANYFPESGGSQSAVLPVGHWAGGYLMVDASPWNAALAGRTIGSVVNPIAVDGQGGTDTVHVLGSAGRYSLTRIDTTTVRLTETGGLGQNAVLKNVEAVVFADGTRTELGSVTTGTAPSAQGGATTAPVPTVTAPTTPIPTAPPPTTLPAPANAAAERATQFLPKAFGAILETTPGAADASMIAGLVREVAFGRITEAQAIEQIVSRADATTSVATLSYQFFTGRIPSEAGLEYLVSPAGPNLNNLNSAYYQGFNLENRYINFAVNLGKLGEGSTRFAAAYGDKDLYAATSQAYETVFGRAPTAEKVHALLDPSFTLAGKTMTRAEYFAAYGQDGPNGIGTKAAMVGWLLAEAEKADVGVYARSNAAFLADLADGAVFGVDLVGVYSRPQFAA